MFGRAFEQPLSFPLFFLRSLVAIEPALPLCIDNGSTGLMKVLDYPILRMFGLDEAAKGALVREMNAYLGTDRLAVFVQAGADAVARELAEQQPGD